MQISYNKMNSSLATLESAVYNKMMNSSLLWNLQFITQKIIDHKFGISFADYNKMMNSLLLWNLQFITQKIIDRKFEICSL